MVFGGIRQLKCRLGWAVLEASLSFQCTRFVHTIFLNNEPLLDAVAAYRTHATEKKPRPEASVSIVTFP